MPQNRARRFAAEISEIFKNCGFSAKLGKIQNPAAPDFAASFAAAADAQASPAPAARQKRAAHTPFCALDARKKAKKAAADL